MTWLRVVVVLMLTGVVGCATPPPPPPPVVASIAPKPQVLEPMGVLPQVVPSPLSSEAVRERVRQRLGASGFAYEAPVRDLVMVSTAPGPLARSSRVLMRSPLSEPNCGGSVEVIQAAFEDMPRGSRLSLWCYSSRLEGFDDTGSQCRQRVQEGCPEAGDHLVGVLALDALQVSGL